MAYLLFMLANAALFVRPAELFPALGNLQIYLAFIGGAILCNLQGLQAQLRPRTLIQQPINICVIGVAVAVAVSHMASRGYLSGAFHGFVTMAKIALYYLMFVSVINTPQRLRQLMLVTAVCATIVVGASYLDFQKFKATWEGADETLVYKTLQEDMFLGENEKILNHVIETFGYDSLGNTKFVYRMRGLGIFNDPNDVALLIAVAGMICLYFLTDTSLSLLRLAWLVPLAILAIGYIETQSRGGLLAIGASGAVWASLRYGRKVAFALCAIGMLLAPVALGRAAKIDVSDGTGQDRIQIWGEGLASIKSPAILFGHGEGEFEEIAGHVAHNSYIHAYVELGFLGGTIFFGCFFLPAYAFFIIKYANVRITDPELRRMLPFVAGILTAWGVGIASLSRCYAPSTYMVVALCAAFINLAGFHQRFPCPIVQWNTRTMRRLAFCSFGLLVASFAFVKVFARWGT
ncbi:MAG: O-antigen ligase family protein [Planctomycetaceae bacterium]